MRTFSYAFLSLFVLAFAFVAVGCDSNDDDDLAEAEVFLGTWTVTGISDATGDQTASFAQDVESFSVDFDNDGTYTLTVDFVETDPRTDLQLAGDYTVNEATDALALAATIPGIGPITLGFEYNIVNDDEIELSAGNALINPIFGTSYEGTVQLTVERVN